MRGAPACLPGCQAEIRDLLGPGGSRRGTADVSLFSRAFRPLPQGPATARRGAGPCQGPRGGAGGPAAGHALGLDVERELQGNGPGEWGLQPLAPSRPEPSSLLPRSLPAGACLPAFLLYSASAYPLALPDLPTLPACCSPPSRPPWTCGPHSGWKQVASSPCYTTGTSPGPSLPTRPSTRRSCWRRRQGTSGSAPRRLPPAPCCWAPRGRLMKR